MFKILKKLNESALRPNLGHPNLADELNHLNQIELKRQEEYSKAINQYLVDLRSIIKKNADQFYKQLSKSNEFLLIKLDDILCVDDVGKHGKSYDSEYIFLFLNLTKKKFCL